MAKCNRQANDMATTMNDWKTPGASDSGHYSSTTKLSSCCVLVTTCLELVFSCSIVVKHALETVLAHNNFLVVPSITKGVVLVKLLDKSDVPGVFQLFAVVAMSFACVFHFAMSS